MFSVITVTSFFPCPISTSGRNPPAPFTSTTPSTLDAFSAGKHVSVQKPMALNLAQADEMIAAASTAGKLLRVYENFLHYPPVTQAIELIEAGEIGDPLTIRIKSNAGFSPNAWHLPLASLAWRFDPEKCGGGPLVFDDGHHKFALAWQFYGTGRKRCMPGSAAMELMPGSRARCRPLSSRGSSPATVSVHSRSYTRPSWWSRPVTTHRMTASRLPGPGECSGSTAGTDDYPACLRSSSVARTENAHLR